MLGGDRLNVRTPLGDFLVRSVTVVARPTDAEAELARRLLRELRFRLEGGDPRLNAAAQELMFLADGVRSSVRPADPSVADRRFHTELLDRLEGAFLAGRLLIESREVPSLGEREFPIPELPALPPPPRETGTHSFEVRFVDEIGSAISGVDAEFAGDETQTLSTNAAGVALLDGVQTASARVALRDVDALAKLLDPRWEKFRPGKPPKESNTQEVFFLGAELGPFALKAEVPNTVVVKPPLGKLSVALFDKTGRVRHANSTFQIDGPQQFEGTTDEQGLLFVPDVFPGDYTLSLALEFFEENDPDRMVDIVESPLVVLAPDAAEPQVRMLGAVPRSILARLNMFFNTNKTFLLPTALPEVRKLRDIYLENAPCELLVVGHADTRGPSDYNDKLSLERAEATIAFLKDDVEGWFKFYSDPEPKKRWGKVEDHLMILAMHDFTDKPKGQDAVRWYQKTRHLGVDGVAGSQTRHALIAEYMSLDGTSLSDFVGEIDATAHGCGENFPLDDTGENLDAAPADEKRDPSDRRVELYFFDPEFGITPPPPGPNSQADGIEYPLWRKRVAETVELEPDDAEALNVTFVEIADAHFRTDSAVVLPEGENPDAKGEHAALTSVGLIATALRFNDEHAGRSVFVAGHTDTAADDALNDELSALRAKVALALLEGDRDAFSKLANERHKNADINQILSWVSQAFEDLSFDCAPAAIGDSIDAANVRGFQRDFNRNKAALGSSAADLAVDGAVGVLTWGAFFDCYEFALQEELGEDAAAVADLRAELKFVDPELKSLGFGEHFPIEELGVDNFRSQTNRRVEIQFFEPGEEPDLQRAKEDPETSELYLPGFYERTPLERPASGATRGTIHMIVLDDVSFEPLAATTYSIVGDELTLAGKTDEDGRLRHDDVPLGDYVLTVTGRAESCAAVVLTRSRDQPQIRALPAAGVRVFEIRVHDAAHKPLANANCTLDILGNKLTAVADEGGLATFQLPLVCPESVELTWVATSGDTFQKTLVLDCSEGELEFVATARLQNLGYPVQADIEIAVARFQMDYGIPLQPIGADGSLPAPVLDELKRIWDDRLCDATKPPAPAG